MKWIEDMMSRWADRRTKWTHWIQILIHSTNLRTQRQSERRTLEKKERDIKDLSMSSSAWKRMARSRWSSRKRKLRTLMPRIWKTSKQRRRMMLRRIFLKSSVTSKPRTQDWKMRRSSNSMSLNIYKRKLVVSKWKIRSLTKLFRKRLPVTSR